MAATVIVLLVLALLVALGTWQLNRSSEKQQLLDRYQNAPQLPAMRPAQLGARWQDYRYRKIRLTGTYDEAQQILLENQIINGRLGYMVMTPFEIANSDKVVLVNRGWIASGDHASRVPMAKQNRRQITGLINHPPGVGIKLGSLDDAAAGWPKYLPYLDMPWLSLQLGKPLHAWIVLLAPSETDGYHRDWRPTVSVGPERHKGYAFQWYTLAIALVFLFVVGSLKPQGTDVDNKEKQ